MRTFKAQFYFYLGIKLNKGRNLFATRRQRRLKANSYAVDNISIQRKCWVYIGAVYGKYVLMTASEMVFPIT